MNMTSVLLGSMRQSRQSPGFIMWVVTLLIVMLSIIGLQSHKLDLLTPARDLLSFKLFPAIMAAYLMAACPAFIWIIARKEWLLKFSRSWLIIASGATFGLLIGRSWETYQVLEQGHWGVTNLYEVSLLLLAFVAGLTPWVENKVDGKTEVLNVAVAPLIVAGVGFTLWLASIGMAGPQHLVPSLKSYWLPFHVVANFVGYGAFCVAAGAGLMHLWRWRQDKRKNRSLLPDQKTCEELGFRAVAVGFPVFTLAILLGAIWAYEAWGGYWSWDPKETWALIVWLVYAGYLHSRMNRKTSDVVLAIWLVVGFLVTMFCYLGVNMWLGGMHSYGSLG